jgi:hypothetical protein
MALATIKGEGLGVVQRRRVKNLLFEVVIGILVVATLLIAHRVLPKGTAFPSGWIWLTLITVLMFEFLITRFAYSSRNRIVTAVMFACHVLFAVFVTPPNRQPQPIYYPLLNTIEFAVFVKILERIAPLAHA